MHRVEPDPDIRRDAILAEALARAPFDGWTAGVLADSAKLVGMAPTQTALLFPRGVADLLEFWSGRLNARLRERAEAADFKALKVREKVAALVIARLEASALHKEAARRAAATLALPPYAALAGRLAWSVADSIWRALGDTSTDFNYYSKRTILAAVWTSTFARWLSDDSEDFAVTRAFLDRRIEDVMKFEKLKTRFRRHADARSELIASIARMRYR